MSEETVEVSRSYDDHLHFRLGPVERWVVGLGALILVSLTGYVFHSFDDRLEKQSQAMETQGKAMSDVIKAQAVTNYQLQTLSSQLADVPSLTRQMAELKVQTDRNAQDIHDLQQVRRLK